MDRTSRLSSDSPIITTAESIDSRSDSSSDDDNRLQVNKSLNLNFHKRKSEAFNEKFEIGELNYDTPFSYCIKKFYGQNLGGYIYHETLDKALDNGSEFIVIMTRDILLIKKYKDDANTDNYCYVNNNPITQIISHRHVKMHFYSR